MSAVLKKTELLRKEILKQLYFNAPLSLSSLSKLTKKSVPIISSAVSELIVEGFVINDGLAPSNGGRRPLMFLLNPEKRRYIVAVAVDQAVTRMIIYHFNKKSSNIIEAIDLEVLTDKDALAKLITFIKKTIASSGLSPQEILGVGIGMPGFVDVETGVNHSLFLTPKGTTLRSHLTKQLALPVFIDNDSCLIALAELKLGKARNKRDAMVINIGWGTGLGMIVNGQIFRGHSGFAGEFSHIPLSSSNNLCSCGKRGCLEVETSLLVMTSKAITAVNAGSESSLRRLLTDESKHPSDHFLEAARSGDPLAISILSESAFYLGKGIATLIHIINPEKIILSGRGAVAGKMFLPAIQQAINEFCIPRIADATTIEISEIADEADLLGAANLVIEYSPLH